MITVKLGHEQRSTLIRHKATTVKITGPGGYQLSFGPVSVEHWTYAGFDSETGISSISELTLAALARSPELSRATRALLEAANTAMTGSEMPVALFRWMYQDIEDEGMRTLVPVAFHLPLPPQLATASDAPHPTLEAARDVHAQGWNLRCNRCGGWGASWIRNERPGWGAAALCAPHARELHEEHQRHQAALAPLRAVSFAQLDHAFEQHVGA